MDNLNQDLTSLLRRAGLDNSGGEWGSRILLVAGIVLVCYLAVKLFRHLVIPALQRISAQTRTMWDDHLFDDKVLHAACRLIPPVLLYLLQPLTSDPMLGAIFGGALMGVGLGLILRGGATTGGTDMLAKMVHQKLPFISTGMFLMIIDCVVVIFAAVCIGTTEALFALVCIFINGKVIDMVMLGLSKNKACFVMSDKWAEISHQVLHDMDRGATQLSARGAYSGKERPVLLCVLPPQEVARFKEIVRKEDDRAFMFITEAHEALGEGFDRLAEKD